MDDGDGECTCGRGREREVPSDGLCCGAVRGEAWLRRFGCLKPFHSEPPLPGCLHLPRFIRGGGSAAWGPCPMRGLHREQEGDSLLGRGELE